MPQFQILPQYETAQDRMFSGMGASVADSFKQMREDDALQRLLQSQQQSDDPIQRYMAGMQAGQGLAPEQRRQYIGDVDKMEQMKVQRAREEKAFSQEQALKGAELAREQGLDFGALQQQTGIPELLLRSMAPADRSRTIREAMMKRLESSSGSNVGQVVNKGVSNNMTPAQFYDLLDQSNLSPKDYKAASETFLEINKIKGEDQKLEQAKRSQQLAEQKETNKYVEDITAAGKRSNTDLQKLARQEQLLKTGKATTENFRNLLGTFFEDGTALRSLFTTNEGQEFQAGSVNEIMQNVRKFGYNFTDRDLAAVQKMVTDFVKTGKVNYNLIQYAKADAKLNKLRQDTYHDIMKDKDFVPIDIERRGEERVSGSGAAQKLLDKAMHDINTRDENGKVIAVGIVNPRGELAYVEPAQAQEMKAKFGDKFTIYNPGE